MVKYAFQEYGWAPISVTGDHTEHQGLRRMLSFVAVFVAAAQHGINSVSNFSSEKMRLVR